MMPGEPTPDRPEVVVFRNNLFRVSEPFITQQAQSLRRYKPLYMGRLRIGDPPDAARTLAVQDLARSWALPRIAWQTVARDTRPYLRLLGDRRPRLIHAHFGIDGVYALALSQRLRVPLVTTFHGFDATVSTAALLCSPAWANYPLFRRRLARQGALFLCVSAFIRERVLALGFPEERTRVHFMGVDCQAIQPRAPDEETPTILHVARLVDSKGTRYLLRAFAMLARRHEDVRLVIIGDGSRRRSLEARTRALGLERRVWFAGALPYARTLAWMRKAAMLVLPSVHTAEGRIEGLGMVLLEAAATGVPVIGSDVGGIPEGIVDGETGFLVPPRDAVALARRIEDLLDAPAARACMGARARAFVERRFDLRRQTDQLEDFYDALVAN